MSRKIIRRAGAGRNIRGGSVYRISVGFALLAFLAAARATHAAKPVQTTSQPAPRPNIVLIMSDDMGYSDIGCYGGEIRTPTLDGLAANGLRFSQFYNMARCCPTRASLLTGLHPHQAGMGHMTGKHKNRAEPWQGNLSHRAVTIAEVLRPAGYATYMCGKWHVTNRERAGDNPYNWPLKRGFDRFYGTITGAGSFYDPVTLTRGNRMITPENDATYQPERFYYTDAISDNAVKFISDHVAQRSRKPFFLYVAYTAAHWPMQAPGAAIAKYRGRYDSGYQPVRAARIERLRQLGLIHQDWAPSPQAGDWDKVEHKAWEARCMEVYAAMIDRMDEGIGRIVAELDRQALTQNTLILFLQDNGGCAEGMGRKDEPEWHMDGLTLLGPDNLQTQIWPPMQTRDGRAVVGGPGVMPGGPDTYIAYGRAWANVSNTPFREYKHWVHEGGIATPLIAHWPAEIPRRGDIEHQPGQVIDIIATCVELAGANYPAEHLGNQIQPLEGISLAPAFDGQPIARDALYWEHEGNRAVRAGKCKLVAKGPAGPWELYDMERDRTELHDVAAAQPKRVAEMAAKWESWANRAGVLPWIWKPPYGKKPDRGVRRGGPATALKGAVRHVHDPVMIRDGDAYYVFSTGPGVPMRRSQDMLDWKRIGRVFEDDVPAWAREEIPGAHDIWAPDISYYNGRFHLYYSVSTFGSQRSCIGLATNTTLDFSSPDYRWIDHGKVIESFPSKVDFNAIDANLVLDEQKQPWLAWGSYWGGIKLAQLSPETGKLLDEADPIHALAARPKKRAIEAPFIIHSDGYYYLFVSFDHCCRGVASNYKIMVGRSREITGPYVDYQGRPMLEGHATTVLAGYNEYRGPGHNGVFRENGSDWLVHHMYDARVKGRRTMQIRKLIWGRDGWPVVGEPLHAAAPASQSAGADDLLGIWKHSIEFGAVSYQEFLPEGRMKAAVDHAKWSLDGGVLQLRWPDPSAPNGTWIDACYVAPDGSYYVGRNQNGLVVRGVR